MQKEALKELAKGRPFGAVCQKYDVAPRTLQEWKRKVSLSNGSEERGRLARDYNDDQKLAIAEAYQAGIKQKTILEKHALHHTQLYRILHELGVPLRPRVSSKRNQPVIEVVDQAGSIEPRQTESTMESARRDAEDASHPLHQYISQEVMRAMEVRLLKNENAVLRDMYCELKVENMELQRRNKKGA